MKFGLVSYNDPFYIHTGIKITAHNVIVFLKTFSVQQPKFWDRTNRHHGIFDLRNEQI